MGFVPCSVAWALLWAKAEGCLLAPALARSPPASSQGLLLTEGAGRLAPGRRQGPRDAPGSSIQFNMEFIAALVPTCILGAWQGPGPVQAELSKSIFSLWRLARAQLPPSSPSSFPCRLGAAAELVPPGLPCGGSNGCTAGERPPVPSSPTTVPGALVLGPQLWPQHLMMPLPLSSPPAVVSAQVPSPPEEQPPPQWLQQAGPQPHQVSDGCRAQALVQRRGLARVLGHSPTPFPSPALPCSKTLPAQEPKDATRAPEPSPGAQSSSLLPCSGGASKKPGAPLAEPTPAL